MFLLLAASLPVRIAVIGDRTSRGDDPSVFPACAEQAAMMSPDIVACVGDIIDGYTDDPDELSAQLAEAMEMLRPASAAAPLFLTPGNHDIYSEDSRRAWTAAVGALPSRIERIEGVCMISWDTSTEEDLSDRALGALDSLLALVEPGEPSVLVTHRPFWCMAGVDPGAAERLFESVRRADVEAVIGGHIHTYCAGRIGGTLWVSAGTSGGGCSPVGILTGRFHQTGWLTLDGDSASYTVVPLGSLLPEDVNTMREQMLHYLLETRALSPRPLEAALESAALTVTNPDTVRRTFVLRVEGGGWGLPGETREIDLAAGASEQLWLPQDPVRLYPCPVLVLETLYGPRDRSAVIEVEWPVLRTCDAPLSGSTAIDALRAPGEYPGAPERIFAVDGEAGEDGTVDVVLAHSEGRLCVHAEIAAAPGRRECFALALMLGDRLVRVKVFADGSVDALEVADSGAGRLSEGFEAAARTSEGSWSAEIGVDLPEDIRSVPVHIYRLDAGGSAWSWAWPLEFDERAMGMVRLI
jgi:Icc-related predicted phosphoesterase